MDWVCFRVSLACPISGPKTIHDQNFRKNLLGAFAHHSPAGGGRSAFLNSEHAIKEKFLLTSGDRRLSFRTRSIAVVFWASRNKGEMYSIPRSTHHSVALYYISALLLMTSNTKSEIRCLP